MIKKELPAYFRDYLDEKFATTDFKINEINKSMVSVKGSVKGIETHLKELNGSVNKNSNFRKDKLTEFDDIQKKLIKAEKRMRYMCVFMVMGCFVWLKDGRDLIFGIITQLLTAI